MRSIAFLLLTLALGIAASGCGGESGAVSAGPVTAADEPVSVPEAEAEATTVDRGETVTIVGEDLDPGPRRDYRIWLTDGDELAPRWIEADAAEGVAAEALELLLLHAGTDETAIPMGTHLLGINLENGVATVDLTSEFETGGGSRSMFMRLAQVVYTVTEFETVKSVRFHLDGEPVDVFSAEGIVLDEPVTREDYAELLPAIVVDSPRLDQALSSPIVVSGDANVFEANVTVRILGTSGRELARTFTTASCGSGCRGTFSVEVPYEIRQAQVGTVVVEDDDADGDGAPSHRVEIPVRLKP